MVNSVNNIVHLNVQKLFLFLGYVIFLRVIVRQKNVKTTQGSLLKIVNTI